MVDERRTLEQLDGQDWGDPSTAPTGMIARCLRLRRTPLKALTNGDLRLLVSQKIGLKVLVPRALQCLSDDPLMEAEYYPGDLLSALLRVDKKYWSDNPSELEQLGLITRSIMNNGGKIASECQVFLAENSLEC
jgi:CDI immunity proteins